MVRVKTFFGEGDCRVFMRFQICKRKMFSIGGDNLGVEGILEMGLVIERKASMAIEAQVSFGELVTNELERGEGVGPIKLLEWTTNCWKG